MQPSYYARRRVSLGCDALSLPRENVLLVPDRNVLLTGSGWQGGTRSPANDSEGSRSASRVEKSPEETDHPAPGGRRARCHRAARSADAGEAEKGWRPLDGPRASRPVIEPQAA